MFKSKGFTIAFSILSVIAVALLVVLLRLLIHPITPSPKTNDSSPVEEASVPSGETEAEEIRALFEAEEHEYPVAGEVIEEKGKFTLTDQGAAQGVVFHKLPVFDGKEAEGNTVEKSGTFRVNGKVFAFDKDSVYLMYRTEEGFFVTSSPNYVNYEAEDRYVKVTPDPKKVRDDYRDDNGSMLEIIAEDGGHLAFSLYRKTESGMEAVLENVIAAYDSFGAAFEYKIDMYVFKGRIKFAKPGDTYEVSIHFDSPIMMNGTKVTDTVFR